MNGSSYGTSNSGKSRLRAAFDERGRQLLVGEARAEAQARDLVLDQALDQLVLGLGAVELDAGGEQQLAALQPRRGVDQLGDVHPAHVRAGGAPAR